MPEAQATVVFTGVCSMKFTVLCLALFVTSNPAILTAQSTHYEFDTGLAKFSESRYDEAIRIFLASDSANTSARTMFYTGLSYIGMNAYNQGLEFLRKAVAADSLNAGYRFQHAKLLALTGLANEAYDVYQTVTKIDSLFLPAYYQLGLIHQDRKQHEEALTKFRYIIGRNDGDLLAHYSAATSFVALGNNDSAMTYLERCLILNPRYLSAINLLASIKFTKGMFQESRQLYMMASALRPDRGDFVFKTGLTEARLDSHRQAALSFNRAIGLDSTEANYFAHLGQAYYKLGSYDSSLAAYVKAAELDPENPVVFINMAITLTAMDSIDRAKSAYRRAIKAYEPGNIAEVYTKMGAMLYSKRRYRDAAEAYGQALQYTPDDLTALFYLATCYHRLQDARNTRRHFERYLTLAGSDSSQQSRVMVARMILDQLQSKQ